MKDNVVLRQEWAGRYRVVAEADIAESTGKRSRYYVTVYTGIRWTLRIVSWTHCRKADLDRLFQETVEKYKKED